MTILPQQPSRRPRASLSRSWLSVVAVALVAVVVAVVVITRGGSGSGHKLSSAGTPKAVSRPWRVAIHAVSQPAPVGGRFVAYAANAGKLSLVGLDATTGRTAWSLPASPSGVAPGTAPEVAVVGNRVVYLQAVNGNIATVAAADSATGASVWQSPPGLFSDWPTVCPDEATAICVSGQLQDGSAAGVLRFDAATGRSVASAQVGEQAREIAPNLFDVGQRNPELLVATSRSDVAWQRPLHAIFSLPGASTDYGWILDRIPRLGLYIGSISGPPLAQTSTRYAVDLSKAMTAGFRMDNGAVAWRDKGSEYLCGFLTCPGGGTPSYSSVTDAQTGGPTIGIRVRAHGVLSGSPTAIAATVSRDARGVLEGFDPATGHRRWSFDFGRDIGLLTELSQPPRVSATGVVLHARNGRQVVLDVVTGAQRPLPPGTITWCSKIVSYTMTVAYQAGNGHNLHDYVGQYALSPCTPTGKPAPVPSHGTTAMNGLVAQSNGEYAWMQQGAVVAVPV
jgi:hypothetical protein